MGCSGGYFPLSLRSRRPAGRIIPARILQSLKQELCELHAACKEANVAVVVDGFDLLPRVASVSQGGYASDASAYSITVDARQDYNYLFNPAT